MEEKLLLYSYAKLNLFLEVLDKRKDNYHNINTLFERISLSDRITIARREDCRIRIISSCRKIPKNEDNLVWKAASLLQRECGLKNGVDIFIEKNIPVGSGMGGGSSNAAYVLLGLNRLWRLKLARPRLANLAAKLGADVAFFIYDTPFAQGLSKGEKILPLKALSRIKLWHVIAVPKISVLTPVIYRQWDRYSRLTSRLRSRLTLSEIEGLTKPACNVNIITSALKKKSLPVRQAGQKTVLFNSLEQATFKLYPQVERIKEKLKESGVTDVLMSGSGPAVFAIVASKEKALFLKRHLQRNSADLRVFTAHTV